MKSTILDVIVVGAGHAGLSASYHLKQMGLKHIVIEKGTIGNSWQTQRWNSFVLNTANKINALPGDDPQPTSPDGFPTAKQFVTSLQLYVKKFELPVIEKTIVVSIDKSADREIFVVKTNSGGAEDVYYSRQVIICSGAQNAAKLPPIANYIHAGIKHLHASEYRNTAQLPEGAVLVVGSAQSGCQIAEDIAASGKKVYLSTSMVPRVPRHYRGKDIMAWLIETNFFNMKTADIHDPKILYLPVPQLSGAGKIPKTISLQSLAQMGIVILGKLAGADATRLFFEPDAAIHVNFADELSARVKSMMDDYIEKNKIDAPEAAYDPEDMPDATAACITNITTIDIKQKGIETFIWATGFRGNFGYIHLPVLDQDGNPVHKNGATAVEGLYFLGLPWLRTRGSGLIHGIKEDAAFIAARVGG